MESGPGNYVGEPPKVESLAPIEDSAPETAVETDPVVDVRGTMLELYPDLEEDHLLMPSEVAAIFKVNTRTVGRWARDGLIKAIKTPSGHRRYRSGAVLDALAKAAEEPDD